MKLRRTDANDILKTVDMRFDVSMHSELNLIVHEIKLWKQWRIY